MLNLLLDLVMIVIRTCFLIVGAYFTELIFFTSKVFFLIFLIFFMFFLSNDSYHHTDYQLGNMVLIKSLVSKQPRKHTQPEKVTYFLYLKVQLNTMSKYHAPYKKEVHSNQKSVQPPQCVL